MIFIIALIYAILEVLDFKDGGIAPSECFSSSIYFSCM